MANSNTNVQPTEARVPVKAQADPSKSPTPRIRVTFRRQTLAEQEQFELALTRLIQEVVSRLEEEQRK